MTLLSASASSSTATAKQRHYDNSSGALSTSAFTNDSPSASGSTSTTTSPSPTPGQSSASIQSLPLPHQHPLRPHGVRAHLAEFIPLLPRHALFNVKLTIHQLWNVPLVGGEFSVKWKFHGVKRPKAARHHGHHLHHNTHGHGHGHGTTSGSATTTTTTNGRATSATDDHSISSGLRLVNGLGKGKARETLDTDHPYEHESLTPSGASMLSIPSTSEDSSSAPASPHATSFDLFPSSIPGNHVNLGEGSRGKDGDGDTAEFSQEARGRTPYVALREHNVKWGKTINVVVQMSVQRDTQDLQPCDLKLVVEQFAKPGDANAPENPRLGAVYLNLAEYVDKGPISRRYLLRESKTNATLQLTIELTHVGGEGTYKAPPLQKGEVMAGVATLLEKSAVGSGLGPLSVSRPSLRPHRRATDGGSRTSLGLQTGIGTGGSRLGSPVPTLEPGTGGGGGGGGGGGKTADNIIEAIFNPVPTSSPSPSPFTYYVPPKARPIVSPLPLSTSTSGASVSADPQSSDVDADTSGNGLLEDGRPPSIAPSTTTTTRSERSIATSASRDSTGEQRESRRSKWWKKLTGGDGSRAASPQPQPQPPSPVLLHSPVLHAYPNVKGTNVSVRSSPDLLTRQVSEGAARGGESIEDEEHRAAPQIIVRSPPMKGRTLSENESGNGRH